MKRHIFTFSMIVVSSFICSFTVSTLFFNVFISKNYRDLYMPSILETQDQVRGVLSVLDYSEGRDMDGLLEYTCTRLAHYNQRYDRVVRNSFFQSGLDAQKRRKVFLKESKEKELELRGLGFCKEDLSES